MSPIPAALGRAALTLAVAHIGLTAPADAFEAVRFDPVVDIDCSDADAMARAGAGQHALCVQVLGQAWVRTLDAARDAGQVVDHPVPRLGNGGLMPEALDSLRIADAIAPAPLDWPALVYGFNGDRIASCDEYVDQRYHTWMRYRHRVEHLPDARAIFDFTFAADEPLAIGRLHIERPAAGSTPLLTRRGGVSVPLWDPLPWLPSALVPDLGVDVSALPKNDYFALESEELDMVGRSDRQLRARLESGRWYWHVRNRGPSSAARAATWPTPWQWHTQMAERLAHVPDAELRVLARQRGAFRDLLALRRAMRAEGQSRWSADVRAVDAEIMTALRAAEDEGCLHFDVFAFDPARGIYHANRCDWAPDDLLPALARQIEPAIEYDRRRCEADAPAAASVRNGYTYRTRHGLQRRSGIDPYRDSDQLNRYLQRRQDTTRFYLGQFEAAGADGDGPLVPHFQKSYGDSWSWGDRSWVQAGLGYAVGWGLADRAVDGFDDINPHAEGHLWASAWVFDERLPVFDARAAFDVRRDERVVDLVVAGREYLEYGWEQDAGARGDLVHFDVVPGLPGDGFSAGGEACADLSASGVPFELCGSLVGRVGVEVDGRGHGDSSRFEARPYARVDAMGRAGPSVLGIGGGAYIEVNVVDVGLPTVAEMVTGDELGIETHGELEIRSLEGEIGGYVEFPRICVPFVGCAGGRSSTAFFDWPAAIDETFGLFEHGWVADLATWVAVCDQPNILCENQR